MFYINQSNDYFQMVLNSKIYVDKSMLINVTNNNIGTANKYMCVTRMRRSGKTIAESMLNAYYSKGCDSRDQFYNLKISKCNSYEKHLNKHNVLWIDLTDIYCNIKDKDDFTKRLEKSILDDLKRVYNAFDFRNYSLVDAIIYLNKELGERFIFLIDEWDIIFREVNDRKIGNEYLEFLDKLFITSDASKCIDLVYMTGILPINVYSNESALSEFKEYNMITPLGLAEYFGFTDDEISGLCKKYDVDINTIRSWYKGYNLEGVVLYNPLSVYRAIYDNYYYSYWILTSSIESLIKYMNYNNGELKTAVLMLIIGDNVSINVSKFDNTFSNVDSKDKALTVLIHLGYLAYDEKLKSCYIPNYEIRLQFENGIQELNWNEIYNPMSESIKTYEETLKRNCEYVNKVFDKNHKEFASILNKNKEDILGAVTLISYYATKNYYNWQKEANNTLGRSDILFYPKDNNHIPFIVELKAQENTSALDALEQIKSKEYYDIFANLKEVMIVGISYNPKTLKHDTKIEIIKK